MTADLIIGLRNRDQASYRRLIAEYGPVLYRIALRITRAPQDAQDVLQETFLTVMTKVDTVQEPAMLGAWLRKVAVNTALMRLRTRREEPVGDWEADGPEFTSDGSRTQPVSSWPPLPENELLRREAHGVLEEAVSELPDGAREVYILADIEDLPREEVSELLGISREAVRVRLHRARTTLRQALEDYFADRHALTSATKRQGDPARGTEDQGR